MLEQSCYSCKSRPICTMYNGVAEVLPPSNFCIERLGHFSATIFDVYKTIAMACKFYEKREERENA